MSLSNNGKQAEKHVQDALKACLVIPSFDYQRLYDSTSARNFISAQVGDFLIFSPKGHGVIEVKSTAHPHLLSRRAFSDLQRAKLLRRCQAGGHVYALVWHYNVHCWRLIPFADCDTAFNVNKQASLDTRVYPKHPNAQSAINTVIEQLFGVKP